MIRSIRRTVTMYSSFAAMVPKLFLAYSIWVWMQFFVQCISLVIFVAFWKAVYADQATIGGLGLSQTLNYIILAQIFLPAVTSNSVLYNFGEILRDGRIGIELLRPLDFQAAQYVNNLAFMLVGMLAQVPLAAFAWVLFRFELPGDPVLWLAFLVTMLLGNAIVFFFDWMIGCLAFYTTEVWGLSVVRFGISTFFSGALVPLVMMPGWLQTIANALPFAQALYMPVSLLSGITPISAAPGLWLVQLASLVILGFLSRLVFRISIRRVTVQGG